MNDRLKISIITIAVIILGAGAFTYGALTATPEQKPVASAKPTVKKVDLKQLLQSERQTIIGALTSAYPQIKTDYVIAEGQLFTNGQWYGTTLTYQGKDTMNRDTLRVLMEKKDGVWTLLTTPPEPLLSAIELPQVPKSVLDAINQPVSLPGTDDSPDIKS